MRLTHGRVTLELHEIVPRRPGARNRPVPLLLLHSLYGSSADWAEMPPVWPGPVYALDFSGHGRSGWVAGGGYYTELAVADADVALAEIGAAAVAGSGLGAYVALLLAGARPDQVPAALLLPGAGLAGGGAEPDFERPRRSFDLPADGEPAGSGHDPLVRVMGHDVRPLDYVLPFALAARLLLLLEDGEPRPPWWVAARDSPSARAVQGDLAGALRVLSDQTTSSGK